MSAQLRALLAGLLLAAVALVGCGAPDASPPRAAEAPVSPVAPVNPQPSRLTIPSLQLSAPVDRTGLTPDKTVIVPDVGNPERAAWVDAGPTPGEVGRSVIVGHINGGGYPGVFADLATIKVGAEVLVTNAEGRDLKFVVDRVHQFPKDKFPKGLVYGDTDRPEVALVTCGGEFDSAARSHRDNIVVFARLV